MTRCRVTQRLWHGHWHYGAGYVASVSVTISVMSALFLIIAVVFTISAAVVHVAIFVLESVLWSRPAVWKRFGVRSGSEALAIRPMALNQGFYNLFLGLGAAAGVVLLLGSADLRQAGTAVVVFALLSMLGAATVLIVSNPKLARAAAVQGAAPLVGLLALAAATA